MKHTRFQPGCRYFLTLAFILTLTAGAARAGLIYFDDFSGSAAVDLHGTTPDITTGGETWIARSSYKADGSFSWEAHATMTLPFNPLDGFIYNLDVKIENLTGPAHWIQFGFGNGQPLLSGDPIWAGRAWHLVRVASDSNSHVAYLNNFNVPIAWSALGGLRYTEPLDVRVVLDTKGGTGNWQATWYAKRDSDSTYTEVRPTTLLPDEDINSVGISIFNTQKSGNLLSFSLEVVDSFIAKSVSETEVNLNKAPTNLLYTIDVMNDTTNVLGGIVVTDTLPAEVSFISSIPPADQTNNNEYIYNIGTLDTGDTFQILIDVLVTSTAPLIITNVATFITTNTNVAVNTAAAEAETLLYYPTDLALSKTVSGSSSNPIYTITITNQSVAAADNVVVTDTFPATLTFLSSVPVGTPSGSDYIFSLGTLPAGSVTSIILFTEYTSTVPGTVTNTAGVGTSWYEDILSNNSAFVVSPVGAVFDLALSKNANPTSLAADMSNIVYTIQVDNLSTQFICSITVTDTLPPGLVFQFAVPPASQTNGDSYVFDIGCLGPGGTTSVLINTAYTSLIDGITLTNVATVTGTNAETFLVNNSDFALTTIGSDCSTNDTDGDGMSDCEEQCAGTDPMDPNSFLWLEILRTGSPDIRQLTFPTATGRTYWIESSTNLFSNGWTTLLSNLPGLGTNRTQTHTSSTDRIYYRIGVTSP